MAHSQSDLRLPSHTISQAEVCLQFKVRGLLNHTKAVTCTVTQIETGTEGMYSPTALTHAAAPSNCAGASVKSKLYSGWKWEWTPDVIDPFTAAPFIRTGRALYEVDSSNGGMGSHSSESKMEDLVEGVDITPSIPTPAPSKSKSLWLLHVFNIRVSKSLEDLIPPPYFPFPVPHSPPTPPPPKTTSFPPPPLPASHPHPTSPPTQSSPTKTSIQLSKYHTLNSPSSKKQSPHHPLWHPKNCSNTC
ncbi:hypothetical protein BDN72DRAFT_904070 [Pluteus cervinus]|uniref:Uncharacterized protein n=1 Tax=Pluteus cervinus TaxID=181527 RepID=A0ACD3A705_9AGAR|nr:hypothetical protein BDN72DRAFT_904070 [Pluteus cervinus]